MEQVIEQCLYSLIALADDCEDEGEPDRARLLRTCARLLEDEIERYRTAIQRNKRWKTSQQSSCAWQRKR